ncbi:hypothetical protein GGS20DRAFT_536923 [Poronia punctata]|nr:hypothetical protein GGS20DRAFT_536923 [Poronia punctata]
MSYMDIPILMYIASPPSFHRPRYIAHTYIAIGTQLKVTVDPGSTSATLNKTTLRTKYLASQKIPTTFTPFSGHHHQKNTYTYIHARHIMLPNLGQPAFWALTAYVDNAAKERGMELMPLPSLGRVGLHWKESGLLVLRQLEHDRRKHGTTAIGEARSIKGPAYSKHRQGHPWSPRFVVPGVGLDMHIDTLYARTLCAVRCTVVFM